MRALLIQLLSLALIAGIAQAKAPAAAPSSAAAPSFAAAPSSAAAPSPQYKRGKLLFIQCRACHELQADLPDKVGPNLSGLLGRRAGSKEGFAFSPALRAAGFSWDRAMLDRWLEKPSAVVPGNAMAFAGVAVASDRAALLTYLEAETAAPK
jgi:cytochrome c